MQSMLINCLIVQGRNMVVGFILGEVLLLEDQRSFQGDRIKHGGSYGN